MKNERNMLIDYQILKKILNNDAEAILYLFKRYEKYINSFCLKCIYDDNGNKIYLYDEDKSQIIKILTALKKFKL